MKPLNESSRRHREIYDEIERIVNSNTYAKNMISDIVDYILNRLITKKEIK